MAVLTKIIFCNIHITNIAEKARGQGWIKGVGATGAIALQGGLPWWHLFILNKTFVWKFVVIQKRHKNTTQYCDVALSMINDFSASLAFCQF